MSLLRCLIVEDEPLAAEGLAEFIRETPFLQVVGVVHNALDAATFLHQQTADVMFLDIHLPKIKGLDFLRSLPNPPQIILTTAYHQYALEGYDLNVVDYLLKPFGFQRFLVAANKLRRTVPDEGSGRKAYFFNTDKKRIKIYEDGILFAESLKEYTRIHTSEKSVITKLSLSELEQLLGAKNFLRIHKSYLVAVGKIDSYTAGEIEIADIKIPIGRTYKTSVLNFLNAL